MISLKSGKSPSRRENHENETRHERKTKKIAPVFSSTNAIFISFWRLNALPDSRSFHFPNKREKEQKSLLLPTPSSPTRQLPQTESGTKLFFH